MWYTAVCQQRAVKVSSYNFRDCFSNLALYDVGYRLEAVLFALGLQLGDNTLNALCSLRAAKTLVSGHITDVSQPDARATVLSDYVRFLTTPASHSDTYAESCHRSFFSDWQHSRPTSPQEVNQMHPTERLFPLWVPFCINCSDMSSSGSRVCRKTFSAKAKLYVP